jgi:hypothetical protein
MLMVWHNSFLLVTGMFLLREKHCMDGNYMNMNNKYHSRFFHFQFLNLALNGFWFSQIILCWFTLYILGTR